MKRPSLGSQKKVTVENLIGLGPDRLARILIGVAETRPDLKRRLRMELAAEQGPSALAAEIDKRLNSFETSRGKITWRQRPAFVRDLDALRVLIVERLAPMDGFAAIERLWHFMDVAHQVAKRYRERGGELGAVFARAAGGLGRLLGQTEPGFAAASLVESLSKDPTAWKAWLPELLAEAPSAVAEDALRFMSERRGAVPGWISLIRQMADAAEDVETFRATYTADALQTPSIAAEVGRRYLAADRMEEAGEVLRAGAPRAMAPRGQSSDPDFDWETVWIDYLDRVGQLDAAQSARWASFERTLSAERARSFICRLGDFDDVEAATRAFEIAAGYPDFGAGLSFLMNWPALPEAGRMVERRCDDMLVAPPDAELWAAKLRRRFPGAAHLLLRKAAAAASRRRDSKTCDRLTAEAETIDL